MFLDIQMPGMTGLEVASTLRARAHIVFVTAFDQHAIAAFEQGAVDYVLKPVSVPRLATAVARVKERLGRAPADLSGCCATSLAPERARRARYLRWVNASMGTTIAHHRRGDLLFPRRQQVHAGGHRRLASR